MTRHFDPAMPERRKPEPWKKDSPLWWHAGAVGVLLLLMAYAWVMAS